MTRKEAFKEMMDRYDCEVYDCAGDLHIYYQNIYVSIGFWEDIQKWVYGNLWIKNKPEWTTGYSGRLETQELINVLDRYLPKKTEISLF